MITIDHTSNLISPLENIIVNDNYEKMQFVMQKNIILFLRSPINDLIQVNITGAVEYPGTYTLNQIDC